MSIPFALSMHREKETNEWESENEREAANINNLIAYNQSV